MDITEWHLELERLKLVLTEIKSQLQLSDVQAHVSWNQLQDMLSAYWDERFNDDEAQYITTTNSQRQLQTLSYRKIKKLARIALNPYFGRIDFKEDERMSDSFGPDQIYIGIGSFHNPATGEVLICDWRAPICSMFYDYELGKSEYRSPNGLIHGTITLKRQYKIKYGNLEYMFDCELKIDDEVLQKLLSKNVDEKMQTIVTSIQREQNRVIRDEQHRLLVVEGVAGSGKTSIALHRVAYFLYKERDTITSKNILIFSPNHVFSDYIADVLPDLGEEKARQITFGDLIQKSRCLLPNGLRREEWAEQLEYLATRPEDNEYRLIVKSIQVKSSPAFTEFIKNYARYLEQSLITNFPSIIYEKHKILSTTEWKTLWQELAYQPPLQRLRAIRRRIYTKMRPLIKELRRQKAVEISISGEEVNANTIKALARLTVWKELQPLRIKIDHLTKSDIFLIYRQIYEDIDLFGKLADCFDLFENWSAICLQTITRFNQGYLPYEDVMPLFYLQGCLEGFPVDNTIRHLVIDEAQDYTTLQYEIIKRIFPRATWTILGDLDQTIHPWLNIIDFKKISEVFGVEDAVLVKLFKSYRSTSDIVEFSRTILPGKDPIESIDRPGVKPVIFRVGAEEEYVENIAQTIDTLKKEGLQSIAVICKNNQDSVAVYEELKHKTAVNLITKEETLFQRGVTVIPVYLSKGLEFDAVIVHNISSKKYYREWERKMLYIACTRALHRLVLFYSGELSPLLPTDLCS